MTEENQNGILSPSLLFQLSQDVIQNQQFQLFQNATLDTKLSVLTRSRKIITELSAHSFTTILDHWNCTDQKHTGRCWIFAALTLLRLVAINKFGIKDFEFSPNFIYFYDKLEKANFYLEQMIHHFLGKNILDDRTLSEINLSLMRDGGQFIMFVNLINKYGLVPYSAMPETANSTKTKNLKIHLKEILFSTTKQIQSKKDNSTVEDLRRIKNDALKTIYNILALHLGTPPDKFHWSFTLNRLSPKEFLLNHVGFSLDDHHYISLINDPREKYPYKHIYSVLNFGNTIEGIPIKFLNAEISILKNAARDMILHGHLVWIACDFGKMKCKDLGILDSDILEHHKLYGTRPCLNKSDRLDFGLSKLSHAMTLTGLELSNDGTVNYWRVENSHGTKSGIKGFYIMSSSWFDDYVLQVVVHRCFLTKELLDIWDRGSPFGNYPLWSPLVATCDK